MWTLLDGHSLEASDGVEPSLACGRTFSCPLTGASVERRDLHPVERCGLPEP